ncbi:MAG: M16 family metallopeptidase, partial [Acidimicrobiia bacterium]
MAVAVWPKIQFTEERLDNGLRLILSEDHLAPIAAVNIWFNVGSRNEVPGRTGLAHLFEHMMFEGTPRVPKGEWDRLISAVGGV